MSYTVEPKNTKWVVKDADNNFHDVHFFNVSSNGAQFRPIILWNGGLGECPKEWPLSNHSSDESKFRLDLAKYLPILSEKLKAGDVNLAVN